MSQRSGFELLTKDELKRSIAHLVDKSALDRDDFIKLAAFGAKQSLISRWVKEGPISKLDLQRVLRIVREIDSKHGHD